MQVTLLRLVIVNMSRINRMRFSFCLPISIISLIHFLLRKCICKPRWILSVLLFKQKHILISLLLNLINREFILVPIIPQPYSLSTFIKISIQFMCLSQLTKSSFTPNSPSSIWMCFRNYLHSLKQMLIIFEQSFDLLWFNIVSKTPLDSRVTRLFINTNRFLNIVSNPCRRSSPVNRMTYGR